MAQKSQSSTQTAQKSSNNLNLINMLHIPVLTIEEAIIAAIHVHGGKATKEQISDFLKLLKQFNKLSASFRELDATLNVMEAYGAIRKVGDAYEIGDGLWGPIKEIGRYVAEKLREVRE